jgi:uncharacterized protein
VPLVCQRCLGKVEFSIRQERKFCLSNEMPENVADEDPDLDFIPANDKLDVLDLVEEELLLCLPVAPVHAEGECGVIADASSDAVAASPFAILKGLRR